MMKILATLVVAVFMVLVPSPSAAEPGTVMCSTDTEAYTGMAREALCWPVEQDLVVIDGPDNVWKMRAFAERIDPYLNIEITSGSCADYPQAFCVRVVKVESQGPGLAGRMSWDNWPNGGTITLSKWVKGKDMKRTTAAHELLHALGMKHHDGAGLVGDNALFRTTTPMPSAEEMAALQGWYNR
jgi:hypothetical protein